MLLLLLDFRTKWDTQSAIHKTKSFFHLGVSLAPLENSMQNPRGELFLVKDLGRRSWRLHLSPVWQTR